MYFQPFPQEAEGLRFTAGNLSAVRSDGAEFPLSLSLEELNFGTDAAAATARFRTGAPGAVCWIVLDGQKSRVDRRQGRGGAPDARGSGEDGPFIRGPAEAGRRSRAVFAVRGIRPERFSFQSGLLPGQFPSRPVSGLTGYVTNRNDDHITVFDKKSGEVAAIITTGRGPEAIALDQKAGRAYVSLSGEDAVDVLDVTAGSIINSIHLNVGDGPRELSLTPDGKKLLVVNTSSRTLSIIDPRALVELGRVPVGEGARSVLVDREGRRAYVFNELSNTITVIDIANRATVVTLSTDTGPLRGQFNRKGDKLYVIHARSPYLSVIDPFALSVVRKMFVGPGLSSIKVDTVTDMLYVCRKQDAVVEVYDPFSLSPGAYIQAISGVAYMTIDGEENNLYLVSPETRTVMTVNLISRKITTLIDAGEYPAWVTMMGER